MRCTRIVLLLGLFAAVVAFGGGYANAANDEVEWYVAGGVSLPQGNADNALDMGWTLSGGALWFPWDSSLGVQFEGAVDLWDAKNSFLAIIDTNPTLDGIQAADDGDARSWALRADLLWSPESRGSVGFYLKAGVGVNYSEFDLGEYGYVPGYYCDWWWGYCYPYVGTAEYQIASDSSTDFSWNAGAGITFATGGGGKIFVEATYQWVDVGSGFDYVPISIGYRW